MATLTLSLPGALRGCYYYASTTNDTLRAVLDLVRPSAFQNTYQGALVGAPGPIVQAELTSLTPQTVVYTIQPGWRWSNGLPFNGDDLLSWYQHAVVQPRSATDAYRDIGSLTVAANLDQVTAVFAKPFADWDTLFRDINERGTPTTCTLRQLAAQPSLGPYRLVWIKPWGALLQRNTLWRGTRPRFPAIIVRTNLSPASLPAAPVVDYRTIVSTPDLLRLSGDPSLEGHIGSSNQLVVVGFSPHRVLSSQLAVRQALGLAIDRQTLLDGLIGQVSYQQAVADSVIYSQGQVGYPGTLGLEPQDQGQTPPQTTIPTNVGADCLTCARPILLAAGFRRVGRVWRSPHGRILEVRLVVGPSAIDRQASRQIAAQWHALGVPSSRFAVGTETAVAAALAHGRADAGIMTVSTGVSPFITARSWSGPNDGDDFDLGWRSTFINQWYGAALDTFNPDDAQANYLDIDQYITTQAWERPLFTEPSVLTWSAQVVGVFGSTSVVGLVDQVPTWGLQPTS